MTLFKYEVFDAVVKLGSITKAAEKLNLTQSGVSHAISSFETELGFALFSRLRSGIQLTTEGTNILPTVRSVLAQNEILKQHAASIKGLEIGAVTIGTFASVATQWLPAIIKQFKTLHPSINIKFLEGNYEDIENWINNGSVDFGFLSKLAATTFDFIPLKKDPIVCLVPQTHPLHGREEITFQEIKDEIFIMPKWGRVDDLRQCLGDHLVNPRIEYEATEPATVVSMVQHGLGISVMTKMAFQSHEHHNQKVRLIKLNTSYYRLIGLAALSFNKTSPATMAFIDCIKIWLKQHKLSDY